MKSKRITMYVCEKCGWEYRNKEDCVEHEKTHNPMPELENLDIVVFSDGQYGIYVDGIIMYQGKGNKSQYDWVNDTGKDIQKIFRVHHPNHTDRSVASEYIACVCANSTAFNENIVWERKGK